jgi:hypothetical protein
VADGSIGIWIGNDLDVALQLRWGLRLAEARQLNLVVFEHIQRKVVVDNSYYQGIQRYWESSTYDMIVMVSVLALAILLLSL